MKKCIIWGANHFAEMMCYYMEKYTQTQVVAYTVDQKYVTCKDIYGLPLVAFENIEQFYSPQDYSILIALGYKNMNNLRKQKFNEIKMKGYDIESFIHPTAVIENTHLGIGNILLEHVTLGYGVHVGDSNIFWNGSNISHHSQIDDFCYIAPSATTGGKVIMKNQCFLGFNSTIKNGITLAPKTLVGAAAYINKDTITNGVYVPSRSVLLEHKQGEDFL